ncbi:peroxin 13 [Schizosaccharomyces pombe]|uniref:Peroxisomal membrane protein pex13 n=1 Tax=Schizosaccharomyces pombe (strain 972 / ATCC 24843) TaxID=284812 RepID=PEX13_SCHPO|nr:putative peroxin 13 [Schizosaccharomyces pombe]O14136.1 RecName: Full=Peroxisomal membrane protein pex13; AltName: Full=Peroxin-13 [Schizosaccharomyces pombe 972h-]CAB16740.1 peroxin 13 (predicted) [Schizosaccharomyces pombe]|eukprot:NP_593611.1 putative peroxin 13 [Schizosaccharomyces pombe]
METNQNEKGPSLPSYPAGGIMSVSNSNADTNQGVTQHPLANRIVNPNYYNMGFNPYSGFNSFIPSFNPFVPLETNLPGNGPISSLQVIESIVGAVGSIAQVLESTLMAAHMSYNTFVSVSENLNKLKSSIGAIFGIVSLLSRLKRLVLKFFKHSKIDEMNSQEYDVFEKEEGNHKNSIYSIVSSLAIILGLVGLPYAIIRLFKNIYEKEKQIQQAKIRKKIDSLEFCKADYEFMSRDPGVEMSLKKGDIIAILSKTDTQGNPCEWWQGRKRSGETGWFPSNYCSIISR